MYKPIIDSRSQFKELILSSYNGKVWTFDKLKEFGLNKSSGKNMISYLEKESFPKLGTDFCQIAKNTTYFLGEKITTRVKGKPNFILANMELLLTGALLLDLVQNGNQILSYEYDGVVFEGEFPVQKQVLYNEVCQHIVGFIIPLSTEVYYSG